MGVTSCKQGCWLRDRGRDGPPWLAVGDTECSQEEVNARILARHRSLYAFEPGLMAYHVGCDGPLPHPDDEPAKGAAKLPRATHVPPNTPVPVPFDSPLFSGKILFINRQRYAEKTGLGYPYKWHFQGRKRQWEYRIQGRFKRVPQGPLFVGFLPRGCDRKAPVTWQMKMLKKAGMNLHNYKSYVSFGDRGASAGPDSEVGHLVADMTAWDQIIVTPQGSSPPDITGAVGGLGLVRKEMGLERYRREVAEKVLKNLNTRDVYTFQFWGVSQIVDTLGWKFKFGRLPAVDMRTCFGDWPLHAVMYELDPELVAASNFAQDGKHLESLKRYYLDFMFWGSPAECGEVKNMYAFLDAPAEFEEAARRANGADGGEVREAAAPGSGASDTPEKSGGKTSLRWPARWFTMRSILPLGHVCSSGGSGCYQPLARRS